MAIPCEEHSWRSEFPTVLNIQTDQFYQTLDSTNFAKYDQLVQGCLATGAYCIIGELLVVPKHNARFYDESRYPQVRGLIYVYHLV
jgi:hypothetical protein